MSVQWMSVRCCSNLFKHVQIFHKSCPSQRKLHNLTSRHCKPLSNKFLKGNTILICRQYTTDQLKGSKSTLMYLCATGIFMLGMSYAAVPLYRIFCQATGRGGTAVKDQDVSKIESMEPAKNRQITIQFNADKASNMRWQFRPQQYEIKVVPGETALAFYKAKNPTNKPIIGISTYNILPFEAGVYFNKIQCFCFEEQRLNPNEEVDMPVFFYIDPDFMNDPAMEKIENIVLSYTFFEAKEGLTLPYPGYAQQ